MAKLKLVAEPTFIAKVGIPVAGGPPVDVLMTFKHRTRKQWDEWIAAAKASAADEAVVLDDEVKSFMDVVVGWDLEEAFNAENVALLLQNYYGAGHAAVRVYSAELWNNNIKN